MSRTSRNGKKSKSRKNKKNRKKNSTGYNVVILILIAVMLFSGYKLFESLKVYQEGRKAYRGVSELAGTSEFDGYVDFNRLKGINGDTIAWIYQKDSPINYPIVQGGDNDEHLRRLFEGGYAICGTLFVDAAVEEPFTGFNTIVYGHHMRDASMFGSLRNYVDRDYLDDHAVFEIITPEEKYHMDVFAFMTVPADDELYTVLNGSDESSRERYLGHIRTVAEYINDEVDIGIEDNVVVLSTCAYEYDDARYVVVGKLRPWTEEERKLATLHKIIADLKS